MKTIAVLTVFVLDMALFVGLCLCSSILAHRITELVNRKKSVPYSNWWWTLQKQNQVFNDYRGYYPDGELVRKYWKVVISTLTALAVFGIMLFG